MSQDQSISKAKVRTLALSILWIVLPLFILASFPFTTTAQSVTFTPTDEPPIQDLGYGGGIATFSNVNIGTPSSDRVIVVGVDTPSGQTCCGDNPATSVTVGGISAAEAAYSDTSTTSDASLWYASVPSGTTADIVVMGSSSALISEDAGIMVGTITGKSSAAPSATSSHPLVFDNGDPQLIPMTGTMTVPSNGATVLFGMDPVL